MIDYVPSPQILKATLGDMVKENSSLSQAKQSTKCENLKYRVNQEREKHSLGHAFLKSRFNLTSQLLTRNTNFTKYTIYSLALFLKICFIHTCIFVCMCIK